MLLCPIVRQRANMSAKMTRSPIIVLLKCFVDFLSVIRVVGGDWIVYRYLFIDFLFQSLCWVVEHTQDASLYRTLYMCIVHLTFYSDRRSSRKVLNKQKPHLDRLQADEILFRRVENSRQFFYFSPFCICKLYKPDQRQILVKVNFRLQILVILNGIRTNEHTNFIVSIILRNFPFIFCRSIAIQ